MCCKICARVCAGWIVCDQTKMMCTTAKNNAGGGVGEKWTFVCLRGVYAVLAALQRRYDGNCWCGVDGTRGLMYRRDNWIAPPNAWQFGQHTKTGVLEVKKTPNVGSGTEMSG